MNEIINGSIGALLQACHTGPFMRAEIVSLMGLGKLRMECNKVSTALFCNPLDKSPFMWQFIKVDDQHIALSPVNSCIGKPIYASIRDDNNFYVQLQAPHSNDWITAIQRDEIIGFKMHDMNIAQFTGFNGKYIAVNPQPDYVPVQRFSGWRLRSIGESFSKDAQWLINIKAATQQHVKFVNAMKTPNDLKRQMSESGILYDDKLMATLTEQVF